MIVAGIVTYEPDLERLRENLLSIISQVDAVIVFDNSAGHSDLIAGLLSDLGGSAEVMSNGENLGVATALNLLAVAAVERGAKYLVTLDQDSVSPPGMVDILLEAMGQRVGVVTPYIVDRNKITVADYRDMDLPMIEVYRQPARRGAITSGSLVDLKAWSHVGGFDDRFFIDYVDYEFNQRIMGAGYAIVRANRTYLLHEVGRARKTWLKVPRRDLSGHWRLESFYSFGHGAERCYYKARNRVLFTRKHGRELGISHEGIWQIPQQVVLTVLFETEKLDKVKAFWRGIIDGVRMPLDTAVGK